jgi:hypothetical protein
MSGQRRPVGWAALVGVLCAAILVGLSLARSTVPMAGVAHSERGPSTYSVSTSTASPSATPTPDPYQSDVASPRGSSRGPGGLPAAPLATIAEPQAVVGGVVRQGAFCARAAVAQIGSTSSGTTMICSYGDGEDQPRWRAIPVGPTDPTTTKPSTAKPPKPTNEEPTTDEPEESEDPTNEEPTDDEPTTSPQTTIAKPPIVSTFRSGADGHSSAAAA